MDLDMDYDEGSMDVEGSDISEDVDDVSDEENWILMKFSVWIQMSNQKNWIWRILGTRWL